MDEANSCLVDCAMVPVRASTQVAYAADRIGEQARWAEPDVDVAAAGGWKNSEVLRAAYQQPDEATMLDVVLGGGELRERKA